MATTQPKLHLISCGGTFDKIYYDAASDFTIGDSQAIGILEQANVNLSFSHQSLMQKDSLDMDDNDRAQVAKAVLDSSCKRLLITHGTDSMVQTARAIEQALADNSQGKTVILVGAMRPARMKTTDADFNLGFACAAALLSSPGVYLAMNGQLFAPEDCQKNRAAHRFEPIKTERT